MQQTGLKIYSAARAMLTGGDGMFDIGPRPSDDGFRSAFLVAFLAREGQTYEEAIADWQKDWDRLFDRWVVGHLGYDPQRLLPAPPADDPFRLTSGQVAVVARIVAGATAKEAARDLGISPRTAEMHLQAAKARVGARTSVQLAFLFARSRYAWMVAA